jgi:hypothetical protein
MLRVAAVAPVAGIVIAVAGSIVIQMHRSVLVLIH